MNPNHAYATAHWLIDPDADYTVHSRTENGWTQPTDPDHRELPGLDVFLAARRVLRAQPAGNVESTGPNTLDIRAGDGRLWLRFTETTLGENDRSPISRPTTAARWNGCDESPAYRAPRSCLSPAATSRRQAWWRWRAPVSL